MREDIFAHLRLTSYPGRGILTGKSPDGQHGVIAYFIMGRSTNSRNRVLEYTGDGIRTRAYEEERMTDPSLIIYHPVRMLADGTCIVTNGDQTDTVAEALAAGSGFCDALAARTFEPDDPNWTPRISGVLYPDGSYALSILRTLDGSPDCTERAFFAFDHPAAGTAHFISTYEGDGTPLPSFRGAPIFASLPQHSGRQLIQDLWEVLNPENRVSLYVLWTDLITRAVQEYIINSNDGGDIRCRN